MVTPEGQTSSFENNPLAAPNPVSAPKQKQRVTEANPNLSPLELDAFWRLPLAPIAMLAEVLGSSPQGVGRMGFATYRIGGGLFVRPVEVAHGFRALKPEVSK
jgi:hypothetical protein